MFSTPESIAAQLGLRRSGTEYKGPCPKCGGTDRFHVKNGKSARLILHCRHGCSFDELAKVCGLLEKRPGIPQQAGISRDHLEYLFLFQRAYECAAYRGEDVATDADHKKYSRNARLFRQPRIRTMLNDWGLL